MKTYLQEEPTPDNYLSEYLSLSEKEGLIKYYKELINYKEQEIAKLNQIRINLENSTV